MALQSPGLMVARDVAEDLVIVWVHCAVGDSVRATEDRVVLCGIMWCYVVLCGIMYVVLCVVTWCGHKITTLLYLLSYLDVDDPNY